MTAAEYAAGLREFAAWLDANAELVDGGEDDISMLWDSTADIRLYGRNVETVAELARLFGKSEKDYSESTFRLRTTFGVVTVEAVLLREAVCRKVVKGTRVIPAKVIPAQEELHIPEREEEIVEWECEPLLSREGVAS